MSSSFIPTEVPTKIFLGLVFRHISSSGRSIKSISYNYEAGAIIFFSSSQLGIFKNKQIVSVYKDISRYGTIRRYFYNSKYSNLN